MNWYISNNLNPDDCIGIDEVGRGPLAGPVVAAAVWLSQKGIDLLEQDKIVVRDSKKLSHTQRKAVITWINNLDDSIVKCAIASANVEEIDKLNILNATMLAMQRAYNKLDLKRSITLVDGNKAPDLKGTIVKTIVKGDSLVTTISLASIVAKEYRDHIMKELHQRYPQYGWISNVGYGSKQHIECIKQYGATPHHRKTFAPVKDLYKK